MKHVMENFLTEIGVPYMIKGLKQTYQMESNFLQTSDIILKAKPIHLSLAHQSIKVYTQVIMRDLIQTVNNLWLVMFKTGMKKEQ